jgi:hypothetical protein
VRPASTNVTGNLTSVFAIVRPLAPTGGGQASPWSVVLRADDINPDSRLDGTQRRYIVGSSWDLSSRTSVTLDVQSVTFRNGLSGNGSRTFFLHLISNF